MTTTATTIPAGELLPGDVIAGEPGVCRREIVLDVEEIPETGFVAFRHRPAVPTPFLSRTVVTPDYEVELLHRPA